MHPFTVMGCSRGLCQHLRDVWSKFFQAEEKELADYVRYLVYKFFGTGRKHFINYFKWTEDDPVLILDGHMPHCSLDAVSFCTEHYITLGGTRWCIWLRHCATSWRAVGSIPDHVTEIFHWHTPSACTVVLGSSQPLTEKSMRNISWGVKLASA